MHIYTDQVLFDYRVDRRRTDAFALHCHPHYECYFCISGELRYLVEGTPYTPAPRSLLLLASGVFHGVRIMSDAAYARYALHFDENCLPQPQRALLLAPFHSGMIYYTDTDSYRLEEFFSAVAECAEMDEALRDIALPVRIAALLTQVCSMQSANIPQQPREEAALERRIVAYVSAHLTDPLTLDDIARHFFISRNQLCRRFLRATGTTVASFIRQKRLILAQQLRAHGQSAGEAAANAGFGDYSTYYRAHLALLHAPPTGDISSTALR